ncbi:MAG: Fic family protein [Nanoarchaeota archaeon]
MATIIKRKRGDEFFYYLEHSVRKNDKVKKEQKYLGKKIPKDIEHIKREFFHQLFQEKWFSKLNEIKKRFSKQYASFPMTAKEKYFENFMIKFTYDSNKIEGSTLTLRDTANLLKEGITPANKPIKDIKETESHKKLFYIMLDSNKDLSLNTALFWHKILLEAIDAEIAGKIRKHQVAIAGTDVELPFPAEVPVLLEEFFNWYNKEKKKLHPVELAALVHLRFVSIHPFTDGNGRMSRIMMNFILHKNGFPMLNIQYTNRAAYYKALERSQKTKKEQIFVQYIIRRYLVEYEKRGNIRPTIDLLLKEYKELRKNI